MGRLRKKVPRWCYGHVCRENRLLQPAGLREQKDTRQRRRSIVSVAFAADVGPLGRAPGRRATAMVEDGIVKDFAVLHALQVESSQSRVAKSVPGCKGTRYFATFCATSTRLQPKIRWKKGLILNELVQCGRRFDVFEAFTMEESVLQLGLQKMHNVKVHKNTATICATLFKSKKQ